MLAEGLTGSVAEILLAVGLFVLFIVGIFRTYDPRHRASFAYDDQVTIGMDHGNISDSLEAPLLEEVMTYTRGNQTRAANLMGINRGTLRKKLKQYGLG